jgi:chemotaxis protein CheX
MPALEQISESLIRENIIRAVSNVFKTMLARPASMHEANGGPLPKVTTPQVVGTVGFVGDASGLIYLYLDETFATQCTGHVLGMSDFEVRAAGEEVVNDAIGELTNMVAGSFKSALCDAGYPCKLAIPSILRGRNFCVEPMSSAQRQIYHFECGGHRVITDIIIKSGD